MLLHMNAGTNTELRESTGVEQRLVDLCTRTIQCFEVLHTCFAPEAVLKCNCTSACVCVMWGWEGGERGTNGESGEGMGGG
jgi:hypothetical protein